MFFNGISWSYQVYIEFDEPKEHLMTLSWRPNTIITSQSMISRKHGRRKINISSIREDQIQHAIHNREKISCSLFQQGVDTRKFILIEVGVS